ncbi:hypothetical protein [Paenibacillus athensensis]|nr:hypothetical protein [Paenibacillus athensensis]
MTYLGIIIAQSLTDAEALRQFDILAKRQSGDWSFVMVSTGAA